MKKIIVMLFLLVQSSCFVLATEKKLVAPKRHTMTCMQRVVVTLGFMSVLQSVQGAECRISARNCGSASGELVAKPCIDVRATVFKDNLSGPGVDITHWMSRVPLCPQDFDAHGKKIMKSQIAEQLAQELHVPKRDIFVYLFSRNNERDRGETENGIPVCSFSCISGFKSLVMRLIKRD